MGEHETGHTDVERASPAPGDRAAIVEVVIPEAVVQLDGRVVEVFHRATGTSQRWHADHVAVVVRPRRRGGFEYRLGVDVGGTVIGGIRIDVPDVHEPALRALLETARSRRTPVR